MYSPIYSSTLNVMCNRAPWINNVWNFGSSYIIPNEDTVILGGTAQRGGHSTQVSMEDSERILSDIYRMFPSLSTASVVSLMYFCLFLFVMLLPCILFHFVFAL